MKQRIRRRIDFEKAISVIFDRWFCWRDDGETVCEIWYMVWQFGQSHEPNIYKDTKP